MIELSSSATSVLGEGRQAYVAVASKDGPHVTPELYAWSGGRLWFASAGSTLKAKVLARQPAAGALVATAGRAVVLRGEVERFDPRDPRTFLRALGGLPEMTRALLGFTARNVSDLGAFFSDLASGRLGRRMPPVRVLFALRPEHAVLLENDRAVERWAWRDPGRDEPDLPSGGASAVVGVPGPTALPARWFAGDQRLHVPGGLLEHAVGDDVPLGIVVDDYNRPGPAAKQGTLVRGTGRVEDGGWLAVVTHRVVTWEGVEASSTPVGD